MTKSHEDDIRMVFAEDTARVRNNTHNMAEQAKAIAHRRRRRVAIVSVVTLVIAGIGVVGGILSVRSFLVEQERSVVPAAVGSGPLTGEDCPSGINGAAEPFYADDDDSTKTAQLAEEARRLGDRLVSPSYPDAVLTPGEQGDKLKEYVYVLPNGRRVARILFASTSGGTWRFSGMEHC